MTQLFAKRLNAGDDLKQSIVEFVRELHLKNATIVSAVGSLSNLSIRMAGASPEKQDVRQYDESVEIVSLVGTVDATGNSHLHMSFSDSNGAVYGGHVKDGCIVHTTVELVIVTDDQLNFDRKLDEVTGFDELIVEAKS